MPSIRNKSGQTLYVPSLGQEIEPDQVVDVSADALEGFTCQSIWEDATAPSSSKAAKATA